MKKSNEQNIILSRDYFLIAAAVAPNRLRTWASLENRKIEKLNEKIIFLSCDRCSCRANERGYLLGIRSKKEPNQGLKTGKKFNRLWFQVVTGNTSQKNFVP